MDLENLDLKIAELSNTTKVFEIKDQQTYKTINQSIVLEKVPISRLIGRLGMSYLNLHLLG